MGVVSFVRLEVFNPIINFLFYQYGDSCLFNILWNLEHEIAKFWILVGEEKKNNPA